VLLFAAPFALLWPFPVAGITLGYTGMALASAAGLALAVLSPQSGWATWLTNRSWLQRLGVISYGVYVVHLPITAALRASGLLPAGLLFLATVSLVSVAVAALSWHYLESPFLRAPRASGIGSMGTRVASRAEQSPVGSPREAPSVVLPELASHPVLDAEKQ
jgi:peptidoglycan/LPS O-acetylase OafA/YrhL